MLLSLVVLGWTRLRWVVFMQFLRHNCDGTVQGLGSSEGRLLMCLAGQLGPLGDFDLCVDSLHGFSSVVPSERLESVRRLQTTCPQRESQVELFCVRVMSVSLSWV